MPGPIRPTPSRLDESKVQPPRPPNAWIIYRSHHSALLRQNQGGERIAQSVISQMISRMWREEKEDVRREFEKKAEEAKLKHKKQYPNYRFCPQRKEDKLRAKENKRARAKMIKARDATPSDASTSASATSAAPPVPAVPAPFLWPDGMPPPHQMPHYVLPETYYGPCGPSPPVSAAPSPAPYETSHSSDEAVPLAPSTSAAEQSSTSESLPALLQSSVPSEQPLHAPLARLPSSAYTVVPQAAAWNNLNKVPWHEHRDSVSEPVNLTIPVVDPPNYHAFQQPVSQLDRILSTDENNIFNLSTLNSSNLVATPPDGLHIGIGPELDKVDYNGGLFVDDYAEFEKQVTSFVQGGSKAATLPPPDGLETLFLQTGSAEAQPYTAVEQRQSSASFSQEDAMSAYFDFGAMGGSTEDPVAVQPDDIQQLAASAIFTQMTNVPALPVSPASQYVPPTGAANSSTRRVGGSWKPPFFGQIEDTTFPWTFSTN